MNRIKLKFKSILLLIAFKFKHKIFHTIDNFHSINKKKIKLIPSKKFFFSVSLWGAEYIEIFNKVLIPSLLQQNNIPKLFKENYELKFFIFTKGDEPIFNNTNYKALRDYAKIEIINTLKSETYKINEKKYLRDCLTYFISESIKNHAYSMVLTPDHVYGDSSIYNLIKLVEGKDIGIGSICPRINWNSFRDLDDIFNENITMSNKELVKFSLDNLHNAQKQCIGVNSIYVNNFSIEEIKKNFYLVSSSRINVCIVKFTNSDLKFFNLTEDYNQIDFSWPRHLIKEGRYKLIGDSDLFFYSELTKENIQFKEIPKDKDMYELYASKKRLLNHIVNDTFYSTWKF